MSRIAVTINGRTYEIDVRQNFADPTVFSASVDGEEIDIPTFLAPTQASRSNGSSWTGIPTK